MIAVVIIVVLIVIIIVIGLIVVIIIVVIMVLSKTHASWECGKEASEQQEGNQTSVTGHGGLRSGGMSCRTPKYWNTVLCYTISIMLCISPLYKPSFHVMLHFVMSCSIAEETSPCISYITPYRPNQIPVYHHVANCVERTKGLEV